MTLEEWNDLAQRREPLHPDLQLYLEEMPHGLALKHPLVFEMSVDPKYAAIPNQRYFQKLQWLEQAAKERNWFNFIYAYEGPYRIDAFIDVGDELSNKDYWYLLSHVWTDSERTWFNVEDWRGLWNETRPRKKYAMTARERKALKRLPQEITIYRGILDGHLADGMSWTLDRDIAIWFSKRFSTVHKLRPVLLTANAKRSDAHALLLGRQENEIVIDKFVIAATEYVV